MTDIIKQSETNIIKDPFDAQYYDEIFQPTEAPERGESFAAASSSNQIAEQANNVIKGNVIRCVAGYIGGGKGWEITTGLLKSTEIGMATKAGNATYAFWAGNDTPASAEFNVTHAGVLKATGADIAGTITAGSFYYTKQVVYTAFESADGWTNGGDLSIALGGSALITAGTINNVKEITDEIFGGKGLFMATKNPYFLCGLECGKTTEQLIYFGLGDLRTLDGTETGAGFKIVDGTLYAIHTITDGGSATEYTTEITGITLTDSNEYKVIYTSGSKIEFFVNNVLKVTHTTNLHQVAFDDTPVLMNFYIKTTENSLKDIYMRYAMFVQDF